MAKEAMSMKRGKQEREVQRTNISGMRRAKLP